MVLDQFQTTYRKDYLWPYVRAYGIKLTSDSEPIQNPPCKCHCPKIGNKALGSERTEVAWSRLGPMGPLLDSKIYPVKVAASPETQIQISRFNQPNVFLEKLKEKYPFIYECLKTSPPDDFISRINRDRLRTTYQVDYSNMKEHVDASFDQLLRAADVSGSCPCSVPVKLPGDPCRPNQKPIAYRPAVISNRVGGGKGSEGRPRIEEHSQSYCAGSCRGILGTMTGGATEYQDAISRLGQMIMRDKIHHILPKKRI